MPTRTRAFTETVDRLLPSSRLTSTPMKRARSASASSAAFSIARRPFFVTTVTTGRLPGPAGASTPRLAMAAA
jgi:hypothetical protein